MTNNKGSQLQMFCHQVVIACNMRTIVLFLLYAWLLYFCQPCLGSLAKDVLSAGEQISGDTGILVSAGQKFALGFFIPPGSTERYLGIWYYQFLDEEPQTVVWVANRNSPVVDSSGVFQIADDGNLEVIDTSGKSYWSSGLDGPTSTNRTVKLLDSGNLVLLDDHLGMSYLWQSFQHATDTFLPGMKMDTNLELTSWRNASDPRSGSFTFKMAQTRNNHYVILNNQQLHWENDGLNSDAMNPGALNYLANFTVNLSTTKYINQSSTWESYFLDHQYTRILMNSTGEIQFLEWDNPEWAIRWRQPADKCNIYNFCGNFSSCNTKNWFPCKCLPGFFSPRSPENQHSEGRFQGCARKSTSYTNKDMIFLNLTMIKVDSPDQRNSTETEAECQYLCLHMSRPQCQAYSYNVSTYSERSSFTCGIWTRDLPTLIEDDHGGGDLSILVKSSDIASTAKSCEPCGTYMIPYPLSTGSYCGDPVYNKFSCDELTGQVSFMMPGGESYRVTWINEDARKFYIQTNDSNHCVSSYQNDKPNSPFNVTNWCFNEDEIEVNWLPTPEPPCNKSIHCKNWPHSTCSAASEGISRCLCDSKYKWDALNLNCTQEPSRNHSSKRLSLILTVTVTGMIFIACTIIFAYVWRKKITHKLDRVSIQIQESLYDSERQVKGLIGLGGLEENDSGGIEVPFYTFESILAATDNFSDSNKLGRGGYGPVYKGRFPGGQDIAVKRLSSVSTQGLQEFKNEVVLIAKLQHRNLVRLRGYCIKGEEKILLYEYMSNKSLDSFIFDRTRTFLLDWQLRFDIILGIARGLLYLHQDSRLRVIHRDLKTSNILLDEEMNPKISDFGLAKIFGGKETEASTERIVGTYGYMAPEYALDGLFSIKSDVFSFGVVLLEILSGKKNTGFYQTKQTASLLGHAWRLWTENKLLDLMDPSLGETCNGNQFIKCALIGLLCVQDEPGDRPTMSNVVTMLDSETATIATPTQPTFFASRHLSSTASSSSKPEMQFESSYQEGR